MCDAYAGINRMGLGADKLQNAVRAEADRAASQSTKKPAQTRGPPEGKMSVGTTKDGRPVAVVDSDILSHMDTTTWDKAKMREAQGAAKTALLVFKDGIKVRNTDYIVNKTSRDEFTRSEDTKRLYKKQRDAFADKMRAANAVDDIIVATTDWSRDGKLKHPRTDNLVDFLHGDVLISAGNNQYVATTVVGITDTGKYVFYDVTGMTPVNAETKEELSPAAAGTSAVSAIQESSSTGSVRSESKNVNRKYSPDSENDRRKAAQFAVIQSSSAAEDDYHTWIRCAYKRDSLSRGVPFVRPCSPRQFEQGAEVGGDLALLFGWLILEPADDVKQAASAGFVRVFAEYELIQRKLCGVVHTNERINGRISVSQNRLHRRPRDTQFRRKLGQCLIPHLLIKPQIFRQTIPFFHTISPLFV